MKVGSGLEGWEWWVCKIGLFDGVVAGWGWREETKRWKWYSLYSYPEVWKCGRRKWWGWWLQKVDWERFHSFGSPFWEVGYLVSSTGWSPWKAKRTAVIRTPRGVGELRQWMVVTLLHRKLPRLRLLSEPPRLQGWSSSILRLWSSTSFNTIKISRVQYCHASGIIIVMHVGTSKSPNEFNHLAFCNSSECRSLLVGGTLHWNISYG